MIKKLLILAALIYVSVSNAFGGVSLISGVDETVKRTRGEGVRGFYNSFLTQKTFVGVDSLFEEMGPYLNKSYFVSDTYNFLEFNVDSLVETFNMGPKEVFTRPPLRFNSAFAFKYQTIKRIIQSEKDEKFILVGNNEDVDQDVYLQIKAEFPEKVLDIYLHVVKEDGQEFAPGVIPYLTAFDIAVNEFAQGRMKKEKVIKIGKKIFKEKKFHKVFPLYAYCPREAEELKTKPVKTFDFMINNLNKKTLDFCNS